MSTAFLCHHIQKLQAFIIGPVFGPLGRYGMLVFYGIDYIVAELAGGDEQWRARVTSSWRTTRRVLLNDLFARVVVVTSPGGPHRQRQVTPFSSPPPDRHATVHPTHPARHGRGLPPQSPLPLFFPRALYRLRPRLFITHAQTSWTIILARRQSRIAISQ